jgi:CDP-diglyceride synthetase
MASRSQGAMRVVLLGLLSWLIPFAAGFLLFAVKKANAILFTTLMYLVVLVTAGVLLSWYFRKRKLSVREGLLVGAGWLAINLVLDYPMFAFGPMKMTALAYYSEIGLAYLTFPVFGLLVGLLAKAHCER